MLLKKYKLLIILMITLMMFSFTSCTSKNNTYKGNAIIDFNTTTHYNNSPLENTMYVANEVIPEVFEINSSFTFEYERTAYNPFYGMQPQIVKENVNSLATGLAINEEGYIITNAHVVTVENEQNYQNLKYYNRNITVNYADSDLLFEASLITYDTSLDLAILKVDTTKLENFKYATFLNLTNPIDEKFKENDAVKLYYGEKVVAIGNANGQGISVTEGVVSCPYRYFNDGKTIAIQTDAAINSGNSGGPLCNMYAQVIGINSFKIVTNTSESLGYAIPSFIIIDYLNNLNKNNYNIKIYTTSIRG